MICPDDMFTEDAISCDDERSSWKMWEILRGRVLDQRGFQGDEFSMTIIEGDEWRIV